MQRYCDKCDKTGFFWEKELKKARRAIREHGRGIMNSYYCPFGNGIHLKNSSYDREWSNQNERRRTERYDGRGIREYPTRGRKGSTGQS